MHDTEFKATLAAIVASGLLAKHGVDHGAIEPGEIAGKSISIAQAIVDRCQLAEKILEEQQRIERESLEEIPVSPAPLLNSGDAGSASAPLDTGAQAS